jgi:hypothetical protein
MKHRSRPRSRWISRLTVGLAAFSAAAVQAGADPISAADETSDPATSKDKGRYSLFHPTPPERMRELLPDRPDKTESPYTVDAGHFQLEMDFAKFVQDRSDRVHLRSWNLAPCNLKLGLLNNVDLQLVFDSSIHHRIEDRAARSTTTRSGLGDVTTRLKINLWGNDGGQTAFALMPFVKFPTASDQLGNDAVEGGVILPLAVQLPGGWGLGLMSECDFLRNDETSSYHSTFIHSITLGHDLFGKLGGFFEFFSEVSRARGSPWVGTVDLGLSYGLTENSQLDAGVNLGVTDSADDVNPFAGLTVRF